VHAPPFDYRVDDGSSGRVVAAAVDFLPRLIPMSQGSSRHRVPCPLIDIWRTPTASVGTLADRQSLLQVVRNRKVSSFS